MTFLLILGSLIVGWFAAAATVEFLAHMTWPESPEVRFRRLCFAAIAVAILVLLAQHLVAVWPYVVAVAFALVYAAGRKPTAVSKGEIDAIKAAVWKAKHDRIEVRCPQCHIALRFPEDAPKVRCPSCRYIFVTSERTQATAAAESTSANGSSASLDITLLEFRNSENVSGAHTITRRSGVLNKSFLPEVDGIEPIAFDPENEE